MQFVRLVRTNRAPQPYKSHVMCSQLASLGTHPLHFLHFFSKYTEIHRRIVLEDENRLGGLFLFRIVSDRQCENKFRTNTLC